MRTILVFCMLLAVGGPSAASAEGRCTGFKWDISQELALFGGAEVAVAAGKTVAAAPAIGPSRLYELELAPQSQVVFAMTPGKNSAADGAFAGLARLTLDSPGRYRIAVDAPLWIDVVADGRLAVVTDFQGQQNCDGPHKIVEFDLSGARQFVLQISGSARATPRLTVTRSPPRKL